MWLSVAWINRARTLVRSRARASSMSARDAVGQANDAVRPALARDLAARHATRMSLDVSDPWRWIAEYVCNRLSVLEEVCHG